MPAYYEISVPNGERGAHVWQAAVRVVPTPFEMARTHHVHVRTPADVEDALLFCDFLRAHPDEAERYAELKREMAS